MDEDANTERESGSGSGMSAAELAAVREVVLRAYPETVPELVSGASVEEVLGSVEAAAAAYRRIAEGVAARSPAAAAPVVPAGSAPAVGIDPERLPSVEKIRRGLGARR
jgi:hypothetical protein